MKTIKELIKKQEEYESKIILELSKLPKWSRECRCSSREREVWSKIHIGDGYEVIEFCTLCGGYVE